MSRTPSPARTVEQLQAMMASMVESVLSAPDEEILDPDRSAAELKAALLGALRAHRGRRDGSPGA
jgi:hypothetical protein